MKTRKEIIKYILDNNLLDNEEINKDEEYFNYFIISLINSYDCDTFKKNVQENFDLFLSITMISNEAKKVDSEIKEMQEEISRYKQ